MPFTYPSSVVKDLKEKAVYLDRNELYNYFISKYNKVARSTFNGFLLRNKIETIKKYVDVEIPIKSSHLKWTQEEIDFIYDWYERKSSLNYQRLLKELNKTFNKGRSMSSLMHKLKKLKLYIKNPGNSKPMDFYHLSVIANNAKLQYDELKKLLNKHNIKIYKNEKFN